MTRYVSIYAPGGFVRTNLLTIPDDCSKPASWSNELLASARGELNYRLTDPRLHDRLVEHLEQLRREIEIEMRKRLNVKESPEEYAARCLFHESKINYRTGDRAPR